MVSYYKTNEQLQKQCSIFIGIPLKDEVRTSLRQWAIFYSKLWPGHSIHWVLPENYHITIGFLGSIATDKIEQIKNALQDLIRQFTSFEIHLGGLIFLPSKKHPHIIAINVSLNESLGRLHAQIHKKMSELALKLDERPYVPHVTIARVKNSALVKEKIKDEENVEKPSALKIIVNEIALFESHSSAYYQLRERWQF